MHAKDKSAVTAWEHKSGTTKQGMLIYHEPPDEEPDLPFELDSARSWTGDQTWTGHENDFVRVLRRCNSWINGGSGSTSGPDTRCCSFCRVTPHLTGKRFLGTADKRDMCTNEDTRTDWSHRPHI